MNRFRNLILEEMMLVAVWLLISILEYMLQKAGALWPEDEAVKEKWKACTDMLSI